MLEVCPICGSNKLNDIFSCKDYFVSGEVFQLVDCEKCRMRITADFPVESEIGKYYEATDYISHSDTKKGIVNSVYHYVRQFMLKKKARWVEKSSRLKSGAILDVGTGTGYFANTMKERNWQVSTVEQSEKARDFAEKNFGLKGVASISEYVAQSNEKLDVITLWHVLEHIENLNEAMADFQNLLKLDGTLIIAVPNCNSYDARKYKNLWAAYDVPRHLWHFRAEQMTILANKHGFKITEIKPMPFDAFYISMMSENYAKRSFAFFRGMWAGVAGFFASLFDKKMSSSLVYVLKKQNAD